MARMIDADVVTKRFRGWLESPHGSNVYNSGYDAIWHVLDVIDHTPTLTQPNEPLTLEDREKFIEELLQIFFNSNAVALTTPDMERETVIRPDGAPYDIFFPVGYRCQIDFRKIASLIYDAGYRKYRRPSEGEEETP